ncbi:MAG: hypothetical protein CM15mP55_3350 [Hyphomicrobiales bacterium]|nr:MAG: hypothetical protein CM15mP55_3350 [Hyphomicrobiales bacterium]
MVKGQIRGDPLLATKPVAQKHKTVGPRMRGLCGFSAKQRGANKIGRGEPQTYIWPNIDAIQKTAFALPGPKRKRIIAERGGGRAPAPNFPENPAVPIWSLIPGGCLHPLSLLRPPPKTFSKNTFQNYAKKKKNLGNVT